MLYIVELAYCGLLFRKCSELFTLSSGFNSLVCTQEEGADSTMSGITNNASNISVKSNGGASSTVGNNNYNNVSNNTTGESSVCITSAIDISQIV